MRQHFTIIFVVCRIEELIETIINEAVSNRMVFNKLL